VQVCILGRLVIRAERSDVPAGGRRQRRVLARLAMDAGQPVAIDDLEQAVWGDDPPPAARHTIATHVFRLRRLGVSIATVDDGYALETPTDAVEAERLVATARAAITTHDPDGAIELLREALSAWRGEPLVDIDDLPEARIAGARLAELAEGLREELLSLELDGNHPEDLIGRSRKLVDEQPYRERRWELLMLALYRAGRQANALDAYAECRQRLLDDLGIDPGTSLRRMQQAVLAQDPTLESSTSRASTVRTGERLETAGSEPAPPSLEPSRIPGTSTRLIGRALEQRDLAEAWDRTRLVTLLGPPGAGKTRLALESARYDPGLVWYVPLEPLPESRTVAGAVLDVVAPSSRAADASSGVTGALARATGLLVLDGCEGRRTEVAREVGALLAACPGIRVLITSSDRLGINEEAVVPVGPLGPEDAIDLLVDRARLLDPHFRLSPGESASADRLCMLVDRLPLGLELVARHLQMLRLDEVIERVESDVGRWAGGPIGGRAGLWAALDASVERLRPSERRAVFALAVTVADADLDLIAAVAGFDPADIDTFEIVARLVDSSLVQVRSAVGPTRYELLRTLAGRTLETAAPEDLLVARGRYADAVLGRAAELAGRLASAGRSDTLRLLDREMPHIRAVLDAVIGPPVDPGLVMRGLEIAVGLTEYWLGRHPAEGLEWLTRLIAADEPPPRLRAEALLAGGHLAYWVTDFAHGAEIVDEARVLFAALGDPLGEGRALRRRGAIAAATDDLPAARAFLEASLARLDESGNERETGTTLLHLGSLLADEGIVDAARSALERARRIAVATGDPLANGHVLAALTLAYWKGGVLEAAMQTGNEALLIFRELGHRTTEGTVAYRLAAVARGLGRPRAATRYALIAIDAGERSNTRTTVALGHLNLARLDLDSGDHAAAAGHLVRCLDLLDPDTDRWVLVEALEAVSRSLVIVGRPGAEPLLASGATIRSAIRQPVPPTESADLEWTRASAGAARPTDGALEPAAAQTLALAYARELLRPTTSVRRARRARD
jgi:predicted ATPase/DNA-binding SARP family transcriptional activator